MPREAMRGGNRQPREARRYAQHECAGTGRFITRDGSQRGPDGRLYDSRRRNAMDDPNVYTGPTVRPEL